MKKNYIVLKGEDRKYTALNGESNVKIIPINMLGQKVFKIEEVLFLDTMPITITFYADRLGRAISSIKNSYFDFLDAKELYNAAGPIQYKIYLLERIQTSLRLKWQETLEEATISR